MQYGFVLPFGDAKTVARLAQMAEAAGWDALFVWDPVWGISPWVALAAAAVQTKTIRLGTMISPISRRRPWGLASETATLDNLSDGRLILGVGLGAPETGFEQFGEVTDRKTRAELLDECLAILDGLWHGQPFNFDGKHYHVKEINFMPPPPPVQQPRIPVWVVGAWPRPKSMQRALRWDGLLPNVMNEQGEHVPATPEHIRQMREYVDRERAALGLTAPYDIIVEGETPGDDLQAAAEQVHPWAEAGATWWLDAMWNTIQEKTPSLEPVEARLRQGPPRI